MMKRLLSVLLCLTIVGQCIGVAAQTAVSVRAYRQAHEHEILSEFMALLALPNVAADQVNIRRNADAIMQLMARRGLEPRLLEATEGGAPPAVYGELRVPGATRTLVLYAHYDGQPTDPKQWTGSRPWQPMLRSAPLEAGGQIITLPPAGAPVNPEWRLYARSASDDKLGVIAVLTALDALKATGQQPTANLKLFFEGEEEAGSVHLADILRRHKSLLTADAWIIFDGPVHQSGRKQVVFGVRGVTSVDLTVYGAKRPLHSGHYGNWAPNPALLLARLLASMKDERGHVLIQGFYDDVEPLGAVERRALADAPQIDDELKAALGFAQAEGGGKSLLELLNEPSLNIDGMSSAEVGAQARNIIPTEATATLDMRLVRGNDYRRQIERLIAHIRRQGFYVTESAPTDAERRAHPLIARVNPRGGYNAERTPMDLPIALAITRAVQSVSAESIVRLPTLGGSLPLYVLRTELGAPSITVPLANYDNNQHAENENLRLQNLWDGIEISAAIMTMR
jgi:acetylornithine deacetylase/succinyl-diaminopimelate desuccinylase-like protein